MGKHENAWIILRTSGSKTLPLARSLDIAGLEVWTPIQIAERKRPHSPIRVKVEMPILAGFVFARACHLHELAMVRSMPDSQHPQFSFFRYGAGPALVRDSEIERVRKAHEKAERNHRQQKRRRLVMGQRVHFERGIVSGMSGEIIEIRHKGKTALVAFAPGFNMEIDACDIPDNLVSNDSNVLGAAA